MRRVRQRRAAHSGTWLTTRHRQAAFRSSNAFLDRYLKAPVRPSIDLHSSSHEHHCTQCFVRPPHHPCPAFQSLTPHSYPRTPSPLYPRAAGIRARRVYSRCVVPPSATAEPRDLLTNGHSCTEQIAPPECGNVDRACGLAQAGGRGCASAACGGGVVVARVRVGHGEGGSVNCGWNGNGVCRGRASMEW